MEYKYSTHQYHVALFIRVFTDVFGAFGGLHLTAPRAVQALAMLRTAKGKGNRWKVLYNRKKFTNARAQWC